MAQGKKTNPAKGAVNKMQLVKEVLDSSGKSTMPMDIQKAIKDRHGIEMSTSLISNYKHHLLGKGGKGKGKRGRKPGQKSAAPSSGAGRNGTGGISLQDIEAVKKLVDQIGAEKVRQLAQVLAK
jgi:hypothetical protein